MSNRDREQIKKNTSQKHTFTQENVKIFVIKRNGLLLSILAINQSLTAVKHTFLVLSFPETFSRNYVTRHLLFLLSLAMVLATTTTAAITNILYF